MKRASADPQANFEHRRSSVREGWYALAVAGFTSVGLVALQRYFFPNLWKEDPIFAVIAYSILSVVTLLIVYYGFSNIVQCRDFICRIDDQTIECKVPWPGAGDNFHLKLTNIAKVEKNKWSESHRWYIWDTAGNRFWFTSNYKNPVDKFIRAILAKNPSVVEVET